MSVGRRSAVLACQVLLTAAMLLAWQYLPKVGWLSSRSHLFDPYFVSSPTQVAKALHDLAVGANGSPKIWPFLWRTMSASILGASIGMILGAAAGLVLSNSPFVSAVVRPFVVAANATPRVTLIPVIVIIAGTSLTASVIIGVLVVFFVAFFNAYEGGTSIAPQIIDNAKLLGANNWRVLRYIRLPYVMAWTFAGLPLAITFSVISVVTGELLDGYPGMGQLIATATSTGQSTLTFATTFILAVVGLAIVILSDQARDRVLHWWGK